MSRQLLDELPDFNFDAHDYITDGEGQSFEVVFVEDDFDREEYYYLPPSRGICWNDLRAECGENGSTPKLRDENVRIALQGLGRGVSYSGIIDWIYSN